MRIKERGTGDTAARLTAWDETKPIGNSDLMINTGLVGADEAARQIHQRISVRT
jgi:guanylate kinase